MKALHAIYFDGTSYFVDSFEKDYDKDELELIKKSYDIDALCNEAEYLNDQAYD